MATFSQVISAIASQTSTRIQDIVQSVVAGALSDQPSSLDRFAQRLAPVGERARSAIFSALTGLQRALRRIPDFLQRARTGLTPLTSPISFEDALSRLERQTSENFLRLAQSLQTGQMTRDDFQRQFEAELRRAHIAANILGAGGVGNLSANQTAQLEQAVSSQLAFARGFFNAMRNRNVTQQDVRRAASYANALRSTALQAQRQLVTDTYADSGVERRTISPGENCTDCLEAAAEGWQPIGTLPPIGDSECGVNCKCSFSYGIRLSDGTISGV